MMSPEKSLEESNTSAEILENIIPADTAVGNFVFENIRKIAHFTEYGLLGIELALYVAVFTRNKKKSVLATLLFAFITAFLDETIQIFSGRTSSIADVWLDLSGFAVFSALTYLMTFLAVKIFAYIKHRENRNQIDG